MTKKNNQAQSLLNELKDINSKAKNYLSSLNQKMAELDLKYARLLINNDISMMKAAKKVLESKK